MPIPSEQRQDCSDSALRCFGTAYIFERRATPIKSRLQWLAFLGIAGPAALGALVATFALDKKKLVLAITVAGVVSIAQLVISIWALVAHWGDDLAYYVESM